MPARIPIFTKDGIYHIYNRGHNKQPIFFSPQDYQRYMRKLREYIAERSVTFLAYCLMPNHIHLLIKQETEESVERFIHRLHTAYTMYFNIRYGRVGSVFQGRFKAKSVTTDEYLLHLSRYIHLNPLEIIPAQGRALNSVIQYPWSSLSEYASPQMTRGICSTEYLLEYFKNNQRTTSINYLQFIEGMIPKISPQDLEDISNGNM